MRSSSSAFFMSPPASSSAFLHSIMPSPVSSRSSLTMPAVISAIAIPCEKRCVDTKRGQSSPLSAWTPGVLLLFGFLDFDEVLGRLRHHLVDDLAAALEDR